MRESIPEVPTLDIPEGMDDIQYIAAEQLKLQVEADHLKPHAANFLLIKGLGLSFNYFDED